MIRSAPLRVCRAWATASRKVSITTTIAKSSIGTYVEQPESFSLSATSTSMQKE